MLSRLPNDIDVESHVRATLFQKHSSYGSGSFIFGSGSMQAGSGTGAMGVLTKDQGSLTKHAK